MQSTTLSNMLKGPHRPWIKEMDKRLARFMQYGNMRKEAINVIRYLLKNTYCGPFINLEASKSEGNLILI